MLVRKISSREYQKLGEAIVLSREGTFIKIKSKNENPNKKRLIFLEEKPRSLILLIKSTIAEKDNIAIIE